MRSKLATALLVAAFLSAGAFANDRSGRLTAEFRPANQSVIVKNQAWPPRSMMTVEPCALRQGLSI